MKQHQTAVSIPVSVLVVLAFCCLSWTTAATATEASFSLTAHTLNELREDGLPNEILEKLKAIQDKKFDTEDEFLEAIRIEIGADQTFRYKKQFMNRAADDVSAEIKQITKALEEQKRTIDALLAQNRALEDRLAELEKVREERAQQQTEEDIAKQKELEQRVKELETSETARDDAARTIIRDALSTVGSRINESVSFGGSLQMVVGATEKFEGGQSENILELSTAELDFEIQINDWSLAGVIFQWDAFRDLANLDRAFITIGDTNRFPPFMTLGRIVVPFGVAVNAARFFDGRGNPVSITPTAWQVSLAYQFDWNPWVEGIGLFGNYITISYSGSSDLGGVTQFIGEVPTRVGFVPRRRLLVGAGEWFMDNLKLALEYTYNVDYPKSQGGTGNSAHGFFAELTAVW